MLRYYGTERLVFKYSLKRIYYWKSLKGHHAFLLTLTREYLETIRLLAKVKKDPPLSPRKFGRTRCYLDRLRLNGADLSENCRCQRKARIGGFPQTSCGLRPPSLTRLAPVGDETPAYRPPA